VHDWGCRATVLTHSDRHVTALHLDTVTAAVTTTEGDPMASRRRLLLSLISATTLATTSLGVAAVASAAPAPASSPAGAACAAELVPLGPGQTTSTVVSYQCFDTLAESVAFATKGAVRLSSSATTVEQGGEASIEAAAASSLLGIEYTGSSWTGSSLALYGGGGGCGGGASYGFASMPGGWNNVISSARSYSGCTSRHYDGTSYTGSSYLCGCGSMGTMNNRTSSILFR